MRARRVLEAIEVFRTRTGRSKQVGRVALYRYYLTSVLKEPVHLYFEHYGRCSEQDIPVRLGDYITIPKGVLIHGNGARMKGGVQVIGRTRTIEVTDIRLGRDLHPDTVAGDYMNPRLCWKGPGGSQCEVDINHVLVPNSLHGRRGEEETRW